MSALLVSVVSLVALVTAEVSAQVVVRTDSGAVRGVHLTSFSGHQYAAFRGIPYAQPPLGDLRFEPPQPVEEWYDVRDATAYGNSCLQYNTMHLMQAEGTEDCLFVNVFTPRVPTKDVLAEGLPVLVWIHGGAFVSGSGDDDLHGMDYLMDEDVVVVTINYRLGVFGFYTTEDAAAPGNMALRDQQLALRWVQRNIHHFGGDRQRVAISGESAGSASVSLQVVSPLAAGTFQRAISQSGAASASWVLGAPQRPLAANLVKKLSCDRGDTKDWISCLKRVDAAELLHAYGPPIGGLHEEFHPRVDRSDSASPVLPEEPNVLLQRGEFNRVPRIIGQLAHESVMIWGFFQGNANLMRRLEEGDGEAWASAELLAGGGFSDKTDNPVQVAATIRQRLLEDSGGDLSRALMALVEARFMTLSIAAETNLTALHVPVYSYLIDEAGPGQLRFTDVLAKKWLPPNMSKDTPPTHADDLAYLFKGIEQTAVVRGSPQHRMIRLFTQLWTSFARLGYPTVEGAPAWPLFTERSQRHIRLNLAPSVDSHMFEERVRFWRSLPLKEPWNAETWAENSAGQGRSDATDGHTEL